MNRKSLFFFLISLSLLLLFSCRPIVKNAVQRNACTEPAINEMIDSCWVAIPNIFTPNTDGINDGFIPVISCEMDVFRMTIKDGNREVFFTDNVNQAFWDGTFEEEVYLGFLSYEISGVFSGSGTPFSFSGFVASVPHDFTGERNRDVYGLDNCDRCVFADQLTMDGTLSPTNEDQEFLCED